MAWSIRLLIYWDKWNLLAVDHDGKMRNCDIRCSDVPVFVLLYVYVMVLKWCCVFLPDKNKIIKKRKNPLNSTHWPFNRVKLCWLASDFLYDCSFGVLFLLVWIHLTFSFSIYNTSTLEGAFRNIFSTVGKHLLNMEGQTRIFSDTATL